MEQKKIDLDFPILKLKPWDKNPRAMSEQAFKGLKASLKKFGMPQPIIANTKNYRIVGGHMRWEAAKALGWKTVPVSWVSLSAADEKALNVTLNNRYITGTFTDELQEVLHELRSELPPLEMGEIRLPELEVKDAWDHGIENVMSDGEHLDGITSIVKVKCPQEMKGKIEIFLKEKLAETDFVGVTVG